MQINTNTKFHFQRRISRSIDLSYSNVRLIKMVSNVWIDGKGKARLPNRRLFHRSNFTWTSFPLVYKISAGRFKMSSFHYLIYFKCIHLIDLRTLQQIHVQCQMTQFKDTLIITYYLTVNSWGNKANDSKFKLIRNQIEWKYRPFRSCHMLTFIKTVIILWSIKNSLYSIFTDLFPLWAK